MSGDENPQPLSAVHEKEILIRETDLDSFGHVNNAVYLRFFEEARWDLITERGYGIKRIAELQVGPTILEVNLQFRRELRPRDHVRIRTFVTAVSRKVSTVRQTMINDKGEEACIADFVIGLFDMRARRLIEPTPEWKHALGMP